MVVRSLWGRTGELRGRKRTESPLSAPQLRESHKPIDVSHLALASHKLRTTMERYLPGRRLC